MNGKKKVQKAYRAILSLLHQRNLQPGDRLPAQLQLGRELGLCQGTLSGAMQMLVEDKVLSRRQKSGTVILHLLPQNPQRRVWTAGIVMPEFSASGYIAALTMQLHRELANRNFSDRTYFISPQSLPSSEVDVRQPLDFLGLENDLEEGLADALLTSTRLSCSDVPCVALGDFPQSKLRVFRDSKYFFESATRELNSRGIRHIFVVGATREEISLVRRTSEEFPHTSKITNIPLLSINEWAAESAAEEFLSSYPEGESSGLIISDDFFASIFSHSVVQKSRHRPLLCLQSYGGSLLSYSLPTLKYITDLRALSATAVDLVLERLLGVSNLQSEIRLPLTLKEGGTRILSHLDS